MKQEKIKVPKLRFPGFEGEWEEKKLNSVVKFHKGKGISRSDIVQKGQYECIRYGELYTDYGETIKSIISKTNLPPKALFFSKYNDIIIPTSGETQIDIATASCVLKDNVALGGDLTIMRTAENGVYLSYYLNSAKKIEIAKLAQGNTVVHLYPEHLSSLQISLPSIKEQQKIADFLSAVDERIELLKKKKEQLDTYKRGAMQQIFSRRLRFKDGDGKDFPEWEETTLEKMCHLQDGYMFKSTDFIEKKEDAIQIIRI
ncbi:MAG: restriction endonuclease subunit S, partial [Rikenellaceae bacterium]|nr:restriction endonuclease subunit S [Rikenellaceae bacterium]